MKIGPLDISLRGKAPVAKTGADLITPWPLTPGNNGWWPVLRESFSGAWQRQIRVSVDEAATHPTVWSCVTLIASDVSKMRPMLTLEDADGVETEVDNSAYSPVLRKPNHYQNRIQFYAYWMLSKLLRGNAYALKVRDQRGVVVELYLLDPMRVRPLVTPAGDVYYALGQDVLSGVTTQQTVVPAREIIHDSWNCLYHPLCGLSPIYAAGHAAMQGLTIVENATRFFRNGTQIGGLIVAPQEISAQTAATLQEWWDQNYGGQGNIGKTAVLGGGLKFEKPNVMSALDAQMIDQLKWGDEKICATYHVPAYMANVGPLPSYNNVEALTQQYYGQCLQNPVESIELCLVEGLEMKPGYGVTFDIEALDRFDSLSRMEKVTKGVVGGVYTPNEARRKFNLPAVKGGDKVYLQKQNWPLDDLGADATPPAPAALPAAAPEPAEPGEPATPPAPKAIDVDPGRLLAAVLKGLEAAA